MFERHVRNDRLFIAGEELGKQKLDENAQQLDGDFAAVTPCDQPLSCFSGPSLLRVMGDAIALSQFDFHTFGVKLHTSGFGFTHCSHFLFGPFPLSQ